MLKEFKKFILRGNVADLAIAVVIGSAFGAIVTALVTDLITPLVGAIGGQPDFSNLTFTVNGNEFKYGNFLNAAISFLMIGGVIFFLIVYPLNKLQERAARSKKPQDPTEKKCPFCLSEIPKAAKKCKFCTSTV